MMLFSLLMKLAATASNDVPGADQDKGRQREIILASVMDGDEDRRTHTVRENTRSGGEGGREKKSR